MTMVNQFIHNSMNKIVIYTAIFGGYDTLFEPEVKPENVDFICFTDNKELKSDTWQIRYTPAIYNDTTRNARKIKILPHRFLPEYDISIWVDGNIQVIGDVNDLIFEYLTKANIACYDHMLNKLDPRGCIYEEANTIFHLGIKNNGHYKDNPELIRTQMMKYANERYPPNNGLVVSNVMIRKHNSEDVIKCMELWWEELKYGSKRDQLSFNYSAWKTGLNFIYLPGDSRDNEYFLNKGAHTGKRINK